MSYSQHKVVIVSEQQSPRLSYVLRHIFSHFWDVEFRISQEMVGEGAINIVYGDSKVLSEQMIRLPKRPLLFEDDIKVQEVSAKLVDDIPITFYSSSDNRAYDLEYDVFAFVFYHLSRYEEYLPSERDEHNRFQSRYSWSRQNNCLKRAIVDRAILQLGDLINRRYGIQLECKHKFKTQPSFDIDMPYAYKRKGYKAYAGILRDILSGNVGGIQDRSKYWISGIDPFDTYDKIKLLCQDHQGTHGFILQNWNPPHDLNHILGSNEWHSIVKNLDSWSRIGIHPSYQSNHSREILKEELVKLESIIGRSVTCSRQHFLKISLPETYRRLIEIGIQEDHSMSYPDQVGFRAGTAHPFYWYDLDREEATELLIIPYSTMDVTLRYYMKLSPEEAMKCVHDLKSESQDVQGIFGFIWHNSSLSRAYGWYPWQKVLKTCLEELP